MKLNLGSGRFPLHDFVNLNEPDWMAQDGLTDFETDSVDGITVSHLLMYLPLRDWPGLFDECHRVLRPWGGILRITEDETWRPPSTRLGVRPGACTETSSELVRALLSRANFSVSDVGPDRTFFADTSLIQNFHGDPPDVFHVEGMKV